MECHLYMVVLVVPVQVNDWFKVKGLRCVISLYFKLFFTIALVVIEYYGGRLHLHTPKQLYLKRLN